MKRMTVLGLVVVSMCASADAPRLIPFQGRLTTAAGVPVEGLTQLRFRIYTTPNPTVAGDMVFEEFQSLTVTRGAFSANLGAATPLDLALFKNHATLYVGVRVASDADELSPLFRLTTTPWAAHAQSCGDAETIGGQSLASISAPNWTSIQGKPAALDALPSFSCQNGQALVGADGGWGCAPLPDAFTRTEADSRFAQLKSCAWKFVGGDGGAFVTVTCDPGDYVISGGCDANATAPSTLMESNPGPSTGNYKGNVSPWQVGTLPTDPVYPVIDQWRCRVSSGHIDSAFALCCPGR